MTKYSNRFEPSLRNRVRRQMFSRRDKIVPWYASAYAGAYAGAEHPQFYDDKLSELLTYWGEDYGHSGRLDELVAVSDVCFSNDAPHIDSPLTSAAKLVGLQRLTGTSTSAGAATPLILTLGPVEAIAGSREVYAVDVANRSRRPMQDIYVRVNLPPNMYVTTLEHRGDLEHLGEYDRERHEVSWNVPTLAAGRKLTLRYKARAIDGGVMPTIATARSGDHILQACHTPPVAAPVRPATCQR